MMIFFIVTGILNATVEGNNYGLLTYKSKVIRHESARYIKPNDDSMPSSEKGKNE